MRIELDWTKNNGETVSINLLDLHEQHIDIIDIASALHKICRFGGNIPHHYSVLKHSINCYYISQYYGFNTSVQYATLMHDTPEAYTGDLISPIKHFIGDSFYTIENAVQNSIFSKYNVPYSEHIHRLVKDCDISLMRLEQRHFGKKNENLFMPDFIKKQDFSYRSEDSDIDTFLNIFRQFYD